MMLILTLLYKITCCTDFQDNEPLMRALSKLIYLNNPDLVLFVGEALVGNDAVDQLSKFNQVRFYIFSIFVQLQFCFCLNFSHISIIEAILLLQKLADLSQSAAPRLIDGILLTKFDTIDDKV